jgi:hypothetical protein
VAARPAAISQEAIQAPKSSVFSLLSAMLILRCGLRIKIRQHRRVEVVSPRNLVGRRGFGQLLTAYQNDDMTDHIGSA